MYYTKIWSTVICEQLCDTVLNLLAISLIARVCYMTY